MPFEIWRALPALCMPPDEAKQGYRRFGFQWEAGNPAPIGMPLQKAIVTRVGVNCALCHVGRVRDDNGRVRLLPGAPNTQLDVQSYLRFLFACAASPKFTADAIIAEMRRNGRVGPLKAFLYRRLIIPQTRKALLKQARQMAFMDAQPPWGPGRAAGFNPAKMQVLERPYDNSLDTVDIPSLWAMAHREPGSFHWDGINSSLHEVFLNSAIGNGASVKSLDRAALERDETWTRRLAPAAFPMPVDAVKATRGRAVFQQECAGCHAPGGAKVNQVIPASLVGTDPDRLVSINEEVLQAFRDRFRNSLNYRHFRKTSGYVAAPLDGIWARSPYLHNGSVPTLRDLLEPPALRPVSFVRGLDWLDPKRGGFAAPPCIAGAPLKAGSCFDTRLAGNSNAGHLYGTELGKAEKDDLVAFLLTR
jgi:cytochrome c553